MVLPAIIMASCSHAKSWFPLSASSVHQQSSAPIMLEVLCVGKTYDDAGYVYHPLGPDPPDPTYQ